MTKPDVLEEGNPGQDRDAHSIPRGTQEDAATTPSQPEAASQGPPHVAQLDIPSDGAPRGETEQPTYQRGVASDGPSVDEANDDTAAPIVAPTHEPSPAEQVSVDAPKDASQADAERAALKELLERYGIEKAVIVDDEAYDVDFSDVVALVAIHKEGVREALGAAGAELNFEAPELWRDPLEAEWTRLSREEQTALYDRLAAIDGDVTRTHARFASNIRDFLPVPCIVLRPTDWKAREDEFVTDAIVERDGAKWCTTLLLFDLDLNKAGLGTNGGATLVIELLEKHKDVDILCGIVSSLVRADDEGAALADAPAGFDHERVVRISKGDLPDRPNQFVYGVKRSLLAPNVMRLRERAGEIIAASHAAASEKLKQLEIYDVVHAVITRSDEEGVRDFDTFFRVHDVFYKDELRRRAHASEHLAKIAAELRAVSILAPSASKPTDRKTWELQRREIYDDPGDLNGLHLPIELGDVIACDGRDGSTVEYIVLGQPCDLMIRTKDGKRRAEHVLVAKISRNAPAKEEGESLASFRLPYYHERGEDAWVKCANHYTVPVWVLDLCVYNDDGRARFRDDAENIRGLTAAWVKRATLLKADVQKALRRILPQQPQQAKKDGGAKEPPPLSPIAERALGHPFVLASGRVAPLAIEIGCRRVQRVLVPYAADMLTKFGHYLSRTAFEVDLGHGTLELN